MTTDKKIPDIDLERFALGELGAERLKDIENRLQVDPEEAKRLDALFASNEDILTDYPARQMAAGIQERLRRAEGEQKRKAYRIIAPITAVAAVALVIAGVFVSMQTSRPGLESSEIILTKGNREPTLFVYRHRTGGEERLLPGGVAKAGDVIQLRYAAKGAKYGMIFSVDGRGTSTLHFPSSSQSSTALSKRGVQSLSFSYELDDAPDFERFFFVTGSHPIDVESILEIGRSLGRNPTKPLPLPSDLRQSDFLLRKNDK